MDRTWICCLLAVCGSFHQDLAAPVSCQWYPSAEYEDVSMLCSGRHVTRPPRLLPPSLQWLQLQHTAIRSLDSSTFEWRRLPQLSRLSITGGQLSRVGRRALCSLSALASLDLSNNRLSELDPFSFDCNSQLQRLDLSGNPLRRLPALSSSSIDTLHVEHCSISHVNSSFLQALPNLRALYLDGNPELGCSDIKKKLSKKYTSLTVICGEKGPTSSPRSSNSSNKYETQKPSKLKLTPQLLGISSETATVISRKQLSNSEKSPPASDHISGGVTSYEDYEADSETRMNTTTPHSEIKLRAKSDEFNTAPPSKKFQITGNMPLYSYKTESISTGFNESQESVIETKRTVHRMQVGESDEYASQSNFNADEIISQSKVGIDSRSTESSLVGKKQQLTIRSATVLRLDNIDKSFIYIMVSLLSLMIGFSLVIKYLKRRPTGGEHYVIPSV